MCLNTDVEGVCVVDVCDDVIDVEEIVVGLVEETGHGKV